MRFLTQVALAASAVLLGSSVADAQVMGAGRNKTKFRVTAPGYAAGTWTTEIDGSNFKVTSPSGDTFTLMCFNGEIEAQCIPPATGTIKIPIRNCVFPIAGQAPGAAKQRAFFVIWMTFVDLPSNQCTARVVQLGNSYNIRHVPPAPAPLPPEGHAPPPGTPQPWAAHDTPFRSAERTVSTRRHMAKFNKDSDKPNGRFWFDFPGLPELPPGSSSDPTTTEPGSQLNITISLSKYVEIKCPCPKPVKGKNPGTDPSNGVTELTFRVRQTLLSGGSNPGSTPIVGDPTARPATPLDDDKLKAADDEVTMIGKGGKASGKTMAELANEANEMAGASDVKFGTGHATKK